MKNNNEKNMPTATVKKFADKYDVSVKTAEKEWDNSVKIAEDQYGKAKESPKTEKGKEKNNKVYGTAMNIFKNKMKAKKENLITSFSEFVNEKYITV